MRAEDLDTSPPPAELDSLADDQLEEALQTANAAGHNANFLAGRVHPAVSRPIALRMMQTPS